MNPSYAQAHHWFALMLAAENRHVEALTEAQTAQRLDPRSPSIKAATAIVYFMNGKNAEALAECEKAIKLSEGFVPALKVERWVYSTLGDRASAQAVFQKEMSYSGGSLDDPGWNIIELQLVPSQEDLTSSRSRLAKAISSSPVKGNDFTFAFEIALAYQNLGDTQTALDWLERALAAGSHSISFIDVDPRLAPLRSEPRFQSMMKKLG
jgi:tetratricopeptide (TPR) repeat protein